MRRSIPALLISLLAALGLALPGAAPAAAAPASLVVDPTVARLGEAVTFSGTCPRAGTPPYQAVVSGEYNEGRGSVEVYAPVATDGTWTSSWTVDPALFTGTIPLELNCLGYDETLGRAEATLVVLLPEPVDVVVSPSEVPLGGTVSARATCPEGSVTALVSAGSVGDVDDFYLEAMQLDPDGTVAVDIPIRQNRSDLNDTDTPVVGPNEVLVLCLDEGGGVTAVGRGPFTIVDAAAAGPTATVTPAAVGGDTTSGGAELAATGSGAAAGAPGALTGLALVVAGAGLVMASGRRHRAD